MGIADAGVLNANMRVAKLGKDIRLHEHGSEIVGAIELHVHVTRQLDVEHGLDNVRKFSEADSGNGKYLQSAGSTKIEPEFIMEFEQNCPKLDKRKTNQEQKRIDAKRPGTEAWVIFRFSTLR